MRFPLLESTRNLLRITMLSRFLTALPNLLTLARLVLGVGFFWLPASWRLPAVAFAALSDLADGSFSRYFNATSTFGKLLDPIADKAFALGVVVALILDGLLGVGEAFLVGLRDVTVLAGIGWVVLRRDWSAFRHMPPRLLGKIATTAQFLFFLVLLIRGERDAVFFPLTVFLSGWAAVDYAWMFFRRGRERARPTSVE